MNEASAHSPMHPSEGARFLLERDSVADDEAWARYRASIFTPQERYDYVVELRLDGTADVTAASGPGASGGAGVSLEKMLNTIARLTARGAAGRRDDGLAPWPQRVLRWRGPGR